MKILKKLVDERIIKTSYFEDVKQQIRYNYQIAEFYENLADELGDDALYNKSRGVNLCCKYWDLDYYRFQSVKDIKRVNLCKDKFCFNCQSMLAIKRQSKFAPQLDALRKDYKVCHVILTVPNVPGEELNSTLNQMYKKFPYMMRYLKGDKKIKGIDFNQFGYAGGVRSLEVTFNKNTGEFHPHFHCMILFKPDLDLARKHVNKFSFHFAGEAPRHRFCDLEILLQKIWYLLINEKKVTLQSIEDLNVGYDIQVLDSEGYYHECFKYVCKGAFEDMSIYNEQVWRFLQYALSNRRIIQGYGILHNFNDQDREILENELTEMYKQLIAELRAVERPEFYTESLDEVVERSVTCRYVSKSKLKKLLIERRKADGK